MKFLKLILKIILALYAFASLKAQTYVVTQLPALLKLSETDSIQKTERLAAIYFATILWLVVNKPFGHVQPDAGSINNSF